MLRAGAIGGAALVAIATLPSLLGPAAPPSPPPDVGLTALPSPPAAPAPAAGVVPGPSAISRVSRDGVARPPGAKAASGPAPVRGRRGDRADNWAELVRAAESGRLGPRPAAKRGPARGVHRGRGDRRRGPGRRGGDADGGEGASSAAAAQPSAYAPSYGSAPAGGSPGGPGEFRFEH